LFIGQSIGLGSVYQSSEFVSLEGLKVAIIKSGSAVTVCSATTIIGYMSLLYSQNGALYSFGMMAILGEIACLVAALIILPAMLSSKLR
jgi:predicted RND superfamily exporter protein